MTRSPFLSYRLFAAVAVLLAASFLFSSPFMLSPRASAQAVNVASAEVTTAPIALPGDESLRDDADGEILEHNEPEPTEAEKSYNLLRHYISLREGLLFRRRNTQCYTYPNKLGCTATMQELNTLHNLQVKGMLVPAWVGFMETSQLQPTVDQLALCASNRVPIPYDDVDTDTLTPIRVECRLSYNKKGKVISAALAVYQNDGAGPLLFTPPAEATAQAKAR